MMDDRAYAGAKVLVTGGLGFIGSNLAGTLLGHGASVVIVDSSLQGSGANPANVAGISERVQLIRCDILEVHRYEAALSGCDYVFHLAAQTGHVESMRNPVEDLRINALGTLALVDACHKHCPGAAIVFASTRQLYGRPAFLPVDEHHPVAPPDVNAIGKLCAEEVLALYERVYGLRSVRVRLSNCYGPKMRICDAKQMFLGIWVKNALLGKSLTVFGDGKQRRDLLYVQDVVDAFLRAARSGEWGKVFNVGSDTSIELGQLAQLVRRLAGGDSQVELVPFPAERKAIDIGDYVGDYAAFKRATGWGAKWTLEVGLEQTLSYYRDHGSHYLECQ